MAFTSSANFALEPLLAAQYVEGILERGRKKNESFISYWMWGSRGLLFQRFAKMAKPLQRL